MNDKNDDSWDKWTWNNVLQSFDNVSVFCIHEWHLIFFYYSVSYLRCDECFLSMKFKLVNRTLQNFGNLNVYILNNIHLVLQKIGCSGACGDDPLVFRYCAEQFGLPCVWIRERQDCCYVTAPVTIIGCWPDSHQFLIKHVLVACNRNEHFVILPVSLVK